ncbi:zeta toxin family protein [Nocardia bovistercoris]|uniref:UDP-N-acetylglucosamine kinase n=1 Tax=Nocardia bovistercoris TaxID=2785916 RepID=A0A931I9T5_9NOCA|nr:zeta toxin family protein [Nocardia bovistercoris]MBH0777597.1 zeta toxin family protein [Nocardia bovistercoris]
MSAVTAMWEWIPGWILTALNFGMKYPEGDEDDLFDLGDDWRTAADALRALEPELRTVSAATQKFYTGEGAVQAEQEFGKLFSGEASIEETAKALDDLATFTRKGGTDLEHTKIMEAVFAGITCYSVYQLLAAWPWGSAGVPLALGAGRTAVGIAAEQGAKKLALEAGKVGLRNLLKPYLRQIAVAGLKMGAMGAGLDLGIQGYQVAAGHRDGGIDLNQTLHTGVSWAAGGVVAAPVGMGMNRLLGSALTPATRGLISGVTAGAAGGFGMYGAGLGYQVAEQWLAHGHVDWSKVDTTFQWQMVGAGAALGAMHGVRAAGAHPGAAPTVGREGTAPPESRPAASRNPIVTEETRQAGKQAFRDLSKEVHPDKLPVGEAGRADAIIREATQVQADAKANGGYSDQHVARLNELRQEWASASTGDGSVAHPGSAAPTEAAAVRPETAPQTHATDTGARTADSGARPAAPAERAGTAAAADSAARSAPQAERVARVVAPERAAAPERSASLPRESAADAGAADKTGRAGAGRADVDSRGANLAAGQQDRQAPVSRGPETSTVTSETASGQKDVSTVTARAAEPIRDVVSAPRAPESVGRAVESVPPERPLVPERAGDPGARGVEPVQRHTAGEPGSRANAVEPVSGAERRELAGIGSSEPQRPVTAGTGEIRAPELPDAARGFDPERPPARSVNNCGELALWRAAAQTGNGSIRLVEPGSVGPEGMRARDLETAAGGELVKVEGTGERSPHQRIADELARVGGDATVLVVDERTGPLGNHGVGAHAYVMFHDRATGKVMVDDPMRGGVFEFESAAPVAAEHTWGVHYGAEGEQVHPLADGAATRTREFAVGDTEPSSWGIPEFPETLAADHPLLRKTWDIQTPERQAFRDELVENALAGVEPPTDRAPVMYAMGGGSASGKGFLVQLLLKSGVLPRENVVHIDPDSFKEMIPEYRQIIAEGDHRASTMVQSESGEVYGAARNAAWERGLDVILEATMANAESGLRHFQRAHEAGHEVHFIAVTADPATAVTRNYERALQTGRYVPTDVLLKTHKGAAEAFPVLAEAADRVELYDTSGGGVPKLIAIKAPGTEMRILDEAAYARFLNKANLDPAASGPATLYPTERAGLAAETPGAPPAERAGPAPERPAETAVEPREGGASTSDALVTRESDSAHIRDSAETPVEFASAPVLHEILGPDHTVSEFSTALTDRAMEAARQNGTTPEAELMQFVLQRAVARIFTENPHAWILKGGESFLTRFPEGRATTDLDLIRITEGDPARMEVDYNAALARDHGDHLRFVWEKNQPVASGRGIRVFHTVYLGREPIMDLSIDLVPNREIAGYSNESTHWVGEQHPFPARQLFRFEGVGDPSSVRILTMDGFLRQKVAAMYTYDRDNGALPKRCNDLVDLTMLALKTSWDGPRAHEMLRQEFELRRAQDEKIFPPEKFTNPNPKWGREYAKHAQSTPGLPFTTLNEALPLLENFLDPLLRPERPNADWDHRTLSWVPRNGPEVHGGAPGSGAPGAGIEPSPPRSGPAPAESRGSGESRAGIPVAPLTDGLPSPAGALHPAEVKLIAATGDGPPSTVFAEPERIPQWDRLAGGRDTAGSVVSTIDRAMTDPSLPTLADKLAVVRDGLLPEAAGSPSPVKNLDSKNLRFYSYAAGELFIHSAAAMTDPATTIEVGYHRDQVFRDYAREAKANQVSYHGELPEGMTREQADAVALWRAGKGQSVTDVAPAELVRDLLDMHAKPLVDALTVRDRIINEYGVAPERVRIAYGGLKEEDLLKGQTKHTRAHIRALEAIRVDPEGARASMVEAMTGTGERAEQRWQRAGAVVERIEAAAAEHGRSTEKVTLLWVRDQRANPTANRNGLDTQPGVLRQIIEQTKVADPERHIVLVGDDIFHNRTGLREEWAADGVLDGVDARTMVKFWDKADNGGVALGPGEQALVFHRLLQGRDVVQVGTESGALEIPALLGVPTVYLENQVFHLNKGNRWLLMAQEWRYGHFETVRRVDGSVQLDTSGHPVREFHQVGATRPAPLPAVTRVQFGPDLAVPKDRQDVPTDFPHQRVALTADRVYRLVETGELDRWTHRLGRSAAEGAGVPSEWSAEQWTRSEYYADQLHRWLHTEATPESVSRKWDAIRLALRGVLDPGFRVDPEIPNDTLIHPYVVLRTDHPIPVAERDLLSHAYAAPAAERPAAVVAALRTLLADPVLRGRAVADEMLSRLDEAELATLRLSIAWVIESAARGRPTVGAG